MRMLKQAHSAPAFFSLLLHEIDAISREFSMKLFPHEEEVILNIAGTQAYQNLCRNRNNYGGFVPP